ncbi:MAG: hypothetical protein PVS2B2_11360 [Candidatus Acidiferrum sp.]
MNQIIGETRAAETAKHDSRAIVNFGDGGVQIGNYFILHRQLGRDTVSKCSKWNLLVILFLMILAELAKLCNPGARQPEAQASPGCRAPHQKTRRR